MIPNPVHCSTVADITTDSMDGGNPQKDAFQLPKKKKKKKTVVRFRERYNFLTWVCSHLKEYISRVKSKN